MKKVPLKKRKKIFFEDIRSKKIQFALDLPVVPVVVVQLQCFDREERNTLYLQSFLAKKQNKTKKLNYTLQVLQLKSNNVGNEPYK